MFQVYTETPATVTGVFVHTFDLSDMGLLDGDKIRAIEIANLMPADRINVVGSYATSGEVVFSDPNGNLAQAAKDGNADSTFGSSALDPDPLWVGIYNELNAPAVPAASKLAVAAAAVILALGLGVLIMWRRRPA